MRKWSRSTAGRRCAFHGTVCNGLCRQRCEIVVRVLRSLFRQHSTMVLPLIIFGLLFFHRADKTWLLLHPSHSVPTQIVLLSKPITWVDRKPIWDSKLLLYRGICTHFLWSSVLKSWVETWRIWVVTLAIRDFWQATSSSSAWFSICGKELIIIPLSNHFLGLFRLPGEESGSRKLFMQCLAQGSQDLD